MEITIQNKEIYRALNKYVTDPSDVSNNISLAGHYFKIKEYGSAISFLNRINEFAGDSDETYESLILIAECCEQLEERTHQIKTCLAQAIAIDPDRPEAYYKLYSVCEKEGEHQQAYSWICTGLKKLANKKSVTGLIGEGVEDWMYTYHKAREAWWMWRMDECRSLFYQLYNNLEVKKYPTYYQSVINNLKNIGWPKGKDPELALEGVVRGSNYSIEEKLKGFPNTYFMTIGGPRREKLVEDGKKYGVNIIPYDTPKIDLDEEFPYKIDGDILNYLSEWDYKRNLDVLCTHFDMINHWLETTSEDEKWAIFGEDDLSLELVDKWDFVWGDFIKALPENCGIIQLMNVRYDKHAIEFTRWDVWDWSAGAYLLNRDYAKRLIKEYKLGDKHYTFTVPPPYHNSIPEVFLYRDDWGMAYKFSCIVENLNPDLILSKESKVKFYNTEIPPHHQKSRDEIVRMWEEKHKSYGED